jgi:hypothetical protein
MFARARRALAVAGVLAALTLLPTKASAAPLFFSWGGDTIVKFATFPEGIPFTNVQNKHFDAGICYRQVAIFFIPVWNYDVRWCGYVSAGEYIDMTRAEFEERATAAGVTLPSDPPIGAWDAYIGKIVFALLVGGYVLFRMRRKKPAPAAATTQTAAPPPAAPAPPPPAA